MRRLSFFENERALKEENSLDMLLAGYRHSANKRFYNMEGGCIYIVSGSDDDFLTPKKLIG
jgi:hypothetical protein